MEIEKLKKFQLVMIDEKRTHVLYHEVMDKGPRPYIVIRADLYGQFFMAVPITDIVTKNKQLKKTQQYYLETEVTGETSYAKMNFPIIFHKKLINEGIVIPIDKYLGSRVLLWIFF